MQTRHFRIYRHMSSKLFQMQSCFISITILGQSLTIKSSEAFFDQIVKYLYAMYKQSFDN